MNTVLAISLSRVNQLIPFHVFQFIAVDMFSMVYSRTLKTSFSKLLQHRLDLNTENLRILFEGYYTLIGRNMSRKFQIPLNKVYSARKLSVIF